MCCLAFCAQNQAAVLWVVRRAPAQGYPRYGVSHALARHRYLFYMKYATKQAFNDRKLPCCPSHVDAMLLRWSGLAYLEATG